MIGKKMIAFAILLLTLGVSGAFAQARDIEITPFGGARFGGSIDVNSPNIDFLRIKSSVNYGGDLDVGLFPHLQAEFMWNRQDTELSEHDINTGFFTDIAPAKLDQYQFGLLYEFKERHARLRPFIVGGVGFTNFHSNGVLPFDNRFGWNLGGGVKYFVTDHVGLRLESRWSPTRTTSSVGTVCDPFFGCFQTTIHNYAQQGQVNGGIIFKF